MNAQNLKKHEQSQSKVRFILRPNANLGVIGKDLTYSYGLRFLLKAGSNKAYGIEASRFYNIKDAGNFYTVGIILEQKLLSWFNSSIGTIGYFNYGENLENVIGLTSNLGWEPYSKKRLSPFITYRSDLIFSRKIQSINTLNIGLNIKF